MTCTPFSLTPEQQVRAADAHARWFRARTGQKIVLNDNDWAFFERNGLDMSNFVRQEPIPIDDARSIWTRA